MSGCSARRLHRAGFSPVLLPTQGARRRKIPRRAALSRGRRAIAACVAMAACAAPARAALNGATQVESALPRSPAADQQDMGEEQTSHPLGKAAHSQQRSQTSRGASERNGDVRFVEHRAPRKSWHAWRVQFLPRPALRSWRPVGNVWPCCCFMPALRVGGPSGGSRRVGMPAGQLPKPAPTSPATQRTGHVG